MVTDRIAERLERQGLWRRAARRWLEVMDNCASENHRDWLRGRRNYCVSKIKREVASKISLDFRMINRAATAAQISMGIAKPNGSAFRKYDQHKY